jgi:GntR family histidine utilization transcriptional repressor
MSKKVHNTAANIPLYQMVKEHILSLINKRQWAENRRLPSEHELVLELGVSRMTINRALRELAADGIIDRVSGVGTFAAERRVQSHPLEIRDIAQEIAERGHSHESQVTSLGAIRASAEIALYFNVATGSRLFHARILHSESDSPIQLEDRYVYPGFAPAFLEQDFTRQTTTQYLLDLNSSPDEIEQIVMATMPEEDVRSALKMEKGEPCLVLSRRTWLGQKVVTRASFSHPASRYQFGSRYSP